MTIQEIQNEFAVTDDLALYRGSWVAVRDGRIIANAIDAIELRGKPEVRDTDWLLLVPSQLDGSFLL
jgi:hypothetical protein